MSAGFVFTIEKDFVPICTRCLLLVLLTDVALFAMNRKLLSVFPALLRVHASIFIDGQKNY
jgi:hypothetical protein